MRVLQHQLQATVQRLLQITLRQARKVRGGVRAGARLLHQLAAGDAETTWPMTEHPINMSKVKRNTELRVDEGLRKAGEGDAMPQKKYFRQRAHINPLNQTLCFE